MNLHYIALLLAALVLSSPALLAQRPLVELDHVFIVVPADSVASQVQALRDAGFTVAPDTSRHEGQGTASISVLFANAYLELLWVEPSVPVDTAHQQEFAFFERATNWESTGTSPFGIRLRRTGTPGTDLGVPVRRYSAAWMRPGTSIELLTGREERAASDLFVVPSYMAVPAWVEQVASRHPELFAHLSGAQRITRVIVYGREGQEPRSFRALAPAGIEFVAGETTLLEIELDGGARGSRMDLRPGLPLVFVH